MQLRYSTTSPFARKCLIVAQESGLMDKIEIVKTNAWSAETDLPKDNPLCKIPALVTAGGEALYDSPVICEYLDSLHDGIRLVPAAGGERWSQLRLQALADGIMDAAVQVRVERSMRPEGTQWQNWIDRQSAAIIRGCDALEQECGNWGEAFLIGHITVAAALGYLDLRKPCGEWRDGRPNLAAWYDKVSQRASMVATIPVE